MDHNDIRHKLSDYLDDAVTAEEKTAIEEHLAACAECSDALRELRRTIGHLHAVEDIETPAWMTSKIMTQVRDEAERKRGFFHRFVYPLAIKLPVQAAAVLFLTVTAYYIYTTSRIPGRDAEAPPSVTESHETRPVAAGESRRKPPELSAPREKKAAQSPGYRSLDMKYSYEQPAPPVPRDGPESAAATHDEASAGARTSRSASSPAPGVYERSERNDADREAEEQLAITEHFVNHDLRETMKVKGLQIITRKVSEDLAGLEWLREMPAYRTRPCKNRYVVEVELHGASSKYLYCYETSRIRLLGVFELIAGNWTERK